MSAIGIRVNFNFICQKRCVIANGYFLQDWGSKSGWFQGFIELYSLLFRKFYLDLVFSYRIQRQIRIRKISTGFSVACASLTCMRTAGPRYPPVGGTGGGGAARAQDALVQSVQLSSARQGFKFQFKSGGEKNKKNLPFIHSSLPQNGKYESLNSVKILWIKRLFRSRQITIKIYLRRIEQFLEISNSMNKIMQKLLPANWKDGLKCSIKIEFSYGGKG